MQWENEQCSGSTEGAAKCIEEKASLRSLQGSNWAFELGLKSKRLQGEEVWEGLSKEGTACAKAHSQKEPGVSKDRTRARWPDCLLRE